MRTIKTTNEIAPVSTPTRRRALTTSLWIPQILLAFVMGSSGLMKLAGAPEMVDLFAAIGVGQWFRVLVGALEVAGAIGLLIPRLAGLAALGLAGVLLGATITNLLIIDASPWLTIGLMVSSALIAWGRRSQIKQLLPG